MASSYSKSQIKLSTKPSELERIFDRFDANGDGKISPAELRLLMQSIGHELSPEDAEALVASTDADGDGLLDLNEFVKMAWSDDGGEEDEDGELREAFGMYEMEGEGCITAKSLRRMLSRLGSSRGVEECKAMICRFDLNGDGVLSFDEFRVMMQ